MIVLTPTPDRRIYCEPTPDPDAHRVVLWRASGGGVFFPSSSTHPALCRPDGTPILSRWVAEPDGAQALLWGRRVVMRVVRGMDSLEIPVGGGRMMKVRDEDGALSSDWRVARRLAILVLSAASHAEISATMQDGGME